MRPTYIAARIVRKFTPRFIHSYMIRRSIIIKAGLDTSEPESSAKRYISYISKKNINLDGKSVIIFGFGGTFAVAANLLSSGAIHVALVELHDNLQTKMNLKIAEKYSEYFTIENGKAIPKSQYISVHHGDITSNVSELPKADIILSNSVMEHVEDLSVIIDSLCKHTNPAGVHLHFIHIGDHFGKHPFEMLTYSDFVWKHFLNPPSNLNRLRLNDHVESYSKRFGQVSTEILLKDIQEFEKEKPRIRKEFIFDSDDDSAIVFSLFASELKGISD